MIKIPIQKDTFIGVLIAGVLFSMIGIVLYAGVAMVFNGLWWLSIIMFICAWVMFSAPVILFNKEQWFKYIYPFGFDKNE